MLIRILRAVAFAFLLAVTPVLAQTAPSAHVLPFPGDVPQLHAIELAFGAAPGDTLIVSVAAAPEWLGAVTPLGGVAFIGGWGMLARRAARQASL